LCVESPNSRIRPSVFFWHTGIQEFLSPPALGLMRENAWAQGRFFPRAREPIARRPGAVYHLPGRAEGNSPQTLEPVGHGWNRTARQCSQRSGRLYGKVDRRPLRPDRWPLPWKSSPPWPLTGHPTPAPPPPGCQGGAEGKSRGPNRETGARNRPPRGPNGNQPAQEPLKNGVFGGGIGKSDWGIDIRARSSPRRPPVIGGVRGRRGPAQLTMISGWDRSKWGRFTPTDEAAAFD